MSGIGYSDWSYDPFEKMVIFPPDPLFIGKHIFLCHDAQQLTHNNSNKKYGIHVMLICY